MVDDHGIKCENSKVDVYLVSFTIGNKPTEYEAVFYEDGYKVVMARPEIEISLSQDEGKN